MLPYPQLPTDHLYKLATFVGLSMVIGAFYLLNAGGVSSSDKATDLYARMLVFVDRLKDAGLEAKPLADDISGEDVFGRYNEYRDLIRQLPYNSAQAVELRKTNEELLYGRLQSRRQTAFYDIDRENFNYLYWGGAIIMLVGLLWWYYSFQRYQDALIRLTYVEAYQRMLSNGLGQQQTSLPPKGEPGHV